MLLIRLTPLQQTPRVTPSFLYSFLYKGTCTEQILKRPRQRRLNTAYGSFQTISAQRDTMTMIPAVASPNGFSMVLGVRTMKRIPKGMKREAWRTTKIGLCVAASALRTHVAIRRGAHDQHHFLDITGLVRMQLTFPTCALQIGTVTAAASAMRCQIAGRYQFFVRVLGVIQ